MKVIAAVSLLLALFVSPSLRADDPAPASAPAETAAAAPSAAAPAESAYTGESAVVKKAIEDLFDASRKVNGAEKAQARSKIETALDWERVSRECIGETQWKKLPEKNRSEFRTLLKEVVVKTAYSRMDKFWTPTTKYTFDKIEIKGNEAYVKVKFKLNDELFPLDYFLFKSGSKWLIKDIAYEDLRYSQNINEQISAFLREKNFSQLLQNLRKRRDELDSGVKAPKGKG